MAEPTGTQHYILGIGHPANVSTEPDYPALGAGGGDGLPTVTSETTLSVTTTAAASDAAFAVFSSQSCTELVILNKTGVTLEYQRDGAGLTINIRPGQERRITGITNANQIGVRRTDFASGISRASTVTARAITSTEIFVFAGTIHTTISSGGANTSPSSLACTAAEIINTGGKILKWRIGTTSYQFLGAGDSVVVRGITNANQIQLQPYDFVATLTGPIQIEAFTSGLSVPLNIFKQQTIIAPDARIILDDMNYPLLVGENSLWLSVAEQADEKTTLIPRNAITLARFPMVAEINTSQAGACADAATGEYLFGTTSVEYTQPGASTVATFGPASALGTGVDVTDSDIHFEYSFPDNAGTNYGQSTKLSTFAIELYSSGSPASPPADYHNCAVSVFSPGFIKVDARTGGAIVSFSVPNSSFVAVGAGATTTAITWARFKVTGGSSGAGCKFRPHSIRSVKKARSKAAVVFLFDDMHIGQYTGALPILSKYNYPACLAVDTVVKMGQSGFMTPQQLVNVHQRHGWQMVGQVQGGNGASTTIDTGISAEHAISQAARFKTMMKALGISGTEDFSHGSTSFHGASGLTGMLYDNFPALKRMFRDSVSFLGGTNTNPPMTFGESAPFGDPYAIRRMNMSGFTATTFAERWQNHVDQAIANKGVAIFGAHSEFNSAGEALTALGTLVEYIRTQELLGNVEVLTLDGVIKSAY